MLTLQFVSSQEMKKYGEDKIESLLKIIKGNNIVVVDGGLKPEEEAELIKITMDKINNKFRGIEIATINPDMKSMQGIDKIRLNLANMLTGRKQGLTVIGPANIIKEIRKDPNKIQLFTTNSKRRKNAT